MTAGLAVGVLLVPQGMAYAMLAGLPPVYGLYSAIFPQLVYSIFGSSRQLAVGPVAMDSLLVATSISTLAHIGSEHYIELALLLAFIIGSTQVLMGIFKLGFLVNFLSKPVISGFTSAAALIIAASQLKNILGFNIPRSRFIQDIFIDTIREIEHFHWLTFILGILAISVLILFKRYFPKIPAGITVVALSTLLVYILTLTEQGFSVVGEIPKGLPKFQFHSLQIEVVYEIIPIGIVIAIIGFLEAYSVGTRIQMKHSKEYSIKPNQELLALGLSNIVGSFLGSFPTSGGFGRTAVNDQSGAKTPIASWIAASIVLSTLLFLTPLFYYLPKATLASLIIVAVLGLVDLKLPTRLWKADKADFVMLLVTFSVTLFFGIEKGVIIGVGLSLTTLIYKTSEPHTAWLGKVSGTKHYRNLLRYDNAEDHPNISILRIDARLYFANINAVVKIIKEASISKPTLKIFIIDAQGISDIDATALDGLSEIHSHLNSKGITLKITSVIGPVRDKLFKSGMIELLGESNFAPSIDEALGNKENSKLRFQTQD